MDFHGIEKLCGAENWTIWKFAVRNLLRASDGAYEVCVGDVVKPAALPADATSAQIDAFNAALRIWDKADRAASQIIVKTVESKVMALLVACENARDMWDKLHAVFEQRTKQAAHSVQSEFFSFRMVSSDDMVTHLARFENLVLRMQQLNVKPDESSLMVRLLDTLPDSYESLRQSWWARPEEQQTLKHLMDVLTSDESRRAYRREKQDELVALVATKRNGKATRSADVATSKNFTSSDKCETSKNKKVKCFGCGGFGHIKKNVSKC